LSSKTKIAPHGGESPQPFKAAAELGHSFNSFCLRTPSEPARHFRLGQGRKFPRMKIETKESVVLENSGT
jgi:hypothetical protein